MGLLLRLLVAPVALTIGACTVATAPADGDDVGRSEYRPFASVRDDRCYFAADHDAADLCAQWRAAYAAERSAEAATTANSLSSIAMLLSLAGFLGLLFTIRQTTGALAEQRRSFADSRRIGEAQVRCYLAVETIDFHFDRDRRPAISACLVNVGASPAVDVKWRCKIAYTRPDGSQREGGWQRDYPLGVVIPPQGRPPALKVTLDFPLDEAEVEAIERVDGRIGVRVQVRAEGRDVFGKRVGSEGNFVLRIADGEQLQVRALSTSIDEPQG